MTTYGGPHAGTVRRNSTTIDADAWARRFALVVGVAFLAVGVLGFIPGVTTNYGDMAAWKWESGAKLLGIFQVSVLHNLVHVAFGIIGIIAARAARTARSYLLAGGVVYLVLWIYGLAIDKTSDANFVPLNRADDWLHFGLGVAMIALGLYTLRRVASPAPSADRDRYATR